MTIVMKLGGELMTEARSSELDAILDSVRHLWKGGERIALVHGGGPQMSALQSELGQTPRMSGGRRVTDEATIRVLKMVVGGQVNIDLCRALTRAGITAVGMTGVGGPLLACVRRPPSVVPGEGPEPVDLGYVGEVASVRRDLLEALFGAGYVPVVACIGADASGQVYNVNADDVAHALAAALAADVLILVTSTPGVLGDKDDPTTRLPTLTVDQAQEAIAAGVVKGGMIPKVESALGAVNAGVGRVVIIGRLSPGQVEEALVHPGRWGTTVSL